MVRRRRWVVLVTALVALAGACGDDDGGSDDGGTSPPSSTSPSSTAPASTTPCAFDGGTATVTGAAAGDFFQLTAVRAARQPCFDRVVLEFREAGSPAFEVGYQPAPILMDGSGEPVEIEGSAFLVMRVDRASGFDAAASMPSYTGPSRLTPPDTVGVREVVRTGDFEGVLTWVVGLDGERPFTVQVLPDPTRLVVDIG